jgi:putative peptide zinc metalloprotease protein
MAESLFSQSWYRVATLQPRLRSHVRIHHHAYRDRDWFILQDQFTGRHHRFSWEAYQVIGLMNGKRSLQRIWETACERLGEHMPTQDEVIALLSQLHRFDLLQAGVPPDFEELKKRFRSRSSRLFKNLRSPLSIPFPLFDPETFLTRTMPLVRPLLSWYGALLWLLVVGAGLVLAGLHWTELTDNLSDQIFGMQNLALLGLIYPLVKVVHEFGHAYMVKRWGGEVHEMGVMLLVLIPIPYVDASASLSFADKRQRMLVGAAGILVELLLAGLAMLVWVSVEPGAVRAAAFNLMLIAGVSTLLFNGNPLVRFDAYYVLADFLEIPNLGLRGTQQIGYLLKKYLLGIDQVQSPANTPGEARWLAAYAVVASLYRVVLTVQIILFIAGQFFMLGIVLACWATCGMVLAPLARIGRFLLHDPALSRRRSRLLTAVLLPSALLAAVLFLVPFPLHTVAQGVVWPPDESRLFATVDGFVSDLPVASGNHVEAGAVLLRCEDPDLTARVTILTAQREELQARYQLSRLSDLAEAEILKDEMIRVDGELARARERAEALLVRGKSAGTLLLPDHENLLGRFVRRGIPLGYVLAPERMQIRVLVPQEDIDRIRSATSRVSVRLAEHIGRELPARIIRQTPAAAHDLPSMALSTEGGGLFALNPAHKDRPQVFERLFQLDLLPSEPLADKVEERVFVRFEHPPEPLVFRWWRALRRLLMSRFEV